ncbi:site-specific integrase [Paenibacillus endoradicis]|uniref:site-specific integrase n=1 Tax=Paenibacillus endoradicis TaxID=2972487 RepID=UPI00215917B1|nr:site-specific integrase [Paenibacillus endoradicis]MCR8659171.1 site-specific integrase [Paenibacillus endoradicis]
MGTPETEYLIELDFAEEYSFNYNDTIEESKIIMQQLTNEKLLHRGEFEDDEWVFSKTNDYILIMRFQGFPTLFKDMVKCWCAMSLNRIFPETIDSYLHALRIVFPITEQFHISKVENLREYIIGLSSDSTKRHYIYSVKSFLLFTEIENSEDYLVCLNSIPADNKDNIRSLPNFYDVITFQDIINHFMNHWTENEKRIFSPIVIWWKLTSIIPMRIREFCNIRRDCIKQHETGGSIIITRSKHSYQHRHEDMDDTLEIPFGLTKQIIDYIQYSNTYGSSETLISYKMYREELISRKHKGNPSGQRNTNRFNVMNFKRLLEIFYKLIVEEKYGFVDIERIKPNDTRHFSFCSLMLQGIDPLTIARLGGHKKLESQLHYQRHLDYFVQSKIYQMTRMNMLSMKSNLLYNSPLLLENYEVKSLRSINYYKDVIETDEGGYCTDATQMRCESTRSCLLCSKYWISREVLSLRLDELMIMDKEILENIHNRIKIIERYWNEAYSLIDDKDFNIHAKESLKQETKKIKGEIKDSSIIKTLIITAKGDQSFE